MSTGAGSHVKLGVRCQGSSEWIARNSVTRYVDIRVPQLPQLMNDSMSSIAHDELRAGMREAC